MAWAQEKSLNTRLVDSIWPKYAIYCRSYHAEFRETFGACLLDLHKLQYEIHKLIFKLKVPVLVRLHNDLWELARQF